MNSQSGRLSAAEMKERQRQMLDKAASAIPAVTLTEANWRAMIDSQALQVQTLLDIQTQLNTLTTKEELLGYMQKQLDILLAQNQTMGKTMEQYQEDMRQAAWKANRQMEEATKKFSSQVGSAAVEFGRELYAEQEKLDGHRKAVLLISMIPSAILLVIEVLRMIF